MFFKNKKVGDMQLTINDLLIEYMITKIELGYDPKYTMDEFESFLNFINGRLNIAFDQDKYNRKTVLDNFYNKMYEYYWSYVDGQEKINTPHIKRVDDNLLVATDRLGRHDRCATNLCKLNKKESNNLKKNIKHFLSGQKKRGINTSKVPSEESMVIAKEMIIKLIYIMLQNYYENLIEERLALIETRDIYYFVPYEVSDIMIERELTDFYLDGVKRLAYLLDENPDLIISNDENYCLSYANYNYVTKYYGSLLFIPFNKHFVIDSRQEQIIINNNKCEQISQSCMNDVKKLVKKIDGKYQK